MALSDGLPTIPFADRYLADVFAVGVAVSIDDDGLELPEVFQLSAAEGRCGTCSDMPIHVREAISSLPIDIQRVFVHELIALDAWHYQAA